MLFKINCIYFLDYIVCIFFNFDGTILDCYRYNNSLLNRKFNTKNLLNTGYQNQLSQIT